MILLAKSNVTSEISRQQSDKAVVAAACDCLSLSLTCLARLKDSRKRGRGERGGRKRRERERGEEERESFSCAQIHENKFEGARPDFYGKLSSLSFLASMMMTMRATRRKEQKMPPK